jgi:serine/threonine-protein kinase
LIGRTIAQYRILDRLGAGGMGEVYLAQDLRLGRKVALKLLLPEQASRPTFVQRFRREAAPRRRSSIPIS